MPAPIPPVPIPIPAPVSIPAPVVGFCRSRIFVPACSRRPFLHFSPPPSSSHRLAGAMSEEGEESEPEREREQRCADLPPPMSAMTSPSASSSVGIFVLREKEGESY